ncbi:MAG TPA: hypothetical protein VMG14_05040 [Thermoplasmata archaeon]|nr:hypothetical protein [Thermoplasmata archaeon]
MPQDLGPGATSSSAVPATPVHAPVHAPRRWRTVRRRAALAVSAVIAAEIVGAVGFHTIAGLNWVNSIYFESMLATGQGPPLTLANDASKIFASVMAFVSVGSSLSAVLFILGPMLGRAWRFLVEDVERKARAWEAEAATEVQRLERDRR